MGVSQAGSPRRSTLVAEETRELILQAAETEFAVIGQSLPRAIMGVNVDEPEHVGFPSSTGTPQSLPGGADDAEGFQRIIETGHGAFRLSDIASGVIGTLEELEANQDEPKPADFDREAIRKQLQQRNRTAPAGK